MSGLPEGWAVAPIGELIELNPKNACDDDTEVGFVPMPLMGTSYRDEFRCEPRPWGSVKKGYTHFADGDVLLAKITPCFENGKAGLARGLPNGLGAGSTEYFVCRAKQAMLHPAYLFAYFKTHDFVRNGAVEMTGSVGHKRVPKDYVTGTSIPVAPFPEQKRIADKLDSVLARVDACRDRLDRIPALLKRFRQSVLAEATSGRLTADWRAGHCSPQAQIGDQLGKTASCGSMLPSEPVGWTFEQAGSVCARVQSGGTPKEGFSDSGVPFLKVYNLVDQKVAFDYKPQFIAEELHMGSMSKSRVLPGDVLMNIVGPPLGKVAVVPSTHAEWNINQAITLFRPSDRITTGWVFYVLCSGENIADIVHETKGSAGQVNISLSQCRDFVFPVPPVEEQHEIVRRVETLFAFADRLEARCAAARKQAGQLTPALLAKAFRGELVPQDPADEPAAELLKRLAARRAEVPKVQRGRKPVRAAE